jgi:glycosyltransferase involved in cell wall biosynthesis
MTPPTIPTQRRPRILVESYECSPAMDHVPGSAWQILSRLARWFDLWILTEESQYRQQIVDHLRGDPDLSRRMNFVFLRRPCPGGFGRKRPALPFREVFENHLWARKAYALARQLHEHIGFDLAHHLRSNSFRLPGLLWKLPIPFVWGPTGGTIEFPHSMMPILTVKERLIYSLRNTINSLQFRFSPLVRNAARRAAGLLAQTSQDQRAFLRIHHRHAILAHEQASNPNGGFIHQYRSDRQLQIAWIGRFIDSKALPVLLEAVAHPVLQSNITLHIIGDGPKQSDWQAQAKQLGLQSCCVWHGWLNQDQTRDLLGSCNLMTFTSLRDATSATVLQALSLGVPIVCFKICGFGDIVDSSCGIPIPVENPQQAVRDFRAAIRGILDDPERIERLSAGALDTARHYSWDHLAQQIRGAWLSAMGLAQPDAETIEEAPSDMAAQISIV